MNETTKLAREFSAELVREIGTDKVRAAVKLNDENRGAAWCATHDYCDANEVMLTAFKTVTGREFSLDFDETSPGFAQTEKDCGLTNDAWAEAKKNRFYIGMFGVHTPVRTFEFLNLLEAEGIEYANESWANDATDRIVIKGTGLCVWVGDPENEDYKTPQLVTDDNECKVLAEGSFSEIIAAIKNLK